MFSAQTTTLGKVIDDYFLTVQRE